MSLSYDFIFLQCGSLITQTFQNVTYTFFFPKKVFHTAKPPFWKLSFQECRLNVLKTSLINKTYVFRCGSKTDVPNLEKVNASHPFPKKKAEVLLNNVKKGRRTKRKALIQNLNPQLGKTRPFLPHRTLFTFIPTPDYTPLLFFHSLLENTTNNQCLMHLGCCLQVCLSLLHIYR